MRHVDLLTLRLFVATAELLNLTKVAEREHLALAAVSKRISDLEHRTGVQLLYRLPRGLALTPAGDTFLYHARRVLNSLEELDADLSEYSKGVKGYVRIHANTSAIVQFLPEDLSDFVRQHPQIKIDLEEQVSTQTVRAVREGLTDIGIYAGNIGAEGLQVLPYREDHLLVVTPPGHPLAKRTRVSFREVASYDLLALHRDASLYALVSEAAHAMGTTLRIRIQVRSFDAICRMIQAGLGIGILPCKASQAHIRSMKIIGVPLSDSWAKRQLNICIRAYDSLSFTSRQMVDHLSSRQRSTAPPENALRKRKTQAVSG